MLDVPEQSRFEVRVDDELAGFAEYRRRPGLIAGHREEYLDLVPGDLRDAFELAADA